MGEVETLPEPTDTMIVITNPRRADGKDIHYIDANATKVYWPIERINFVELLGTDEDEEIIGFVRE